MKHKLPLSFYQQSDVVSLAQQLLGKYLFTRLGPENEITGGMIVETEAYQGPEDRASHAYNYRRTKRTEVMFLEGGIAYVYFCYGMHHLFNIVTNKSEIPHAILIRSLIPTVGIETMLRRRKQITPNNLSTGPGKICQALGINRLHNGLALDGDLIWLEEHVTISFDKILATPRIGVDYAGEDAFLPWRFILS